MSRKDVGSGFAYISLELSRVTGVNPSRHKLYFNGGVIVSNGISYHTFESFK